MMGCAAPLSYPVLERWALGELAGAAAARVEEHLAGCAACRAALDAIRDDARPLPPLVVVTPARARWWPWVGVVATAAALLALLVRPRDETAVKGGELALELVRERAGVIAHAPADFAPGDRFKALVTCAGGPAEVELVVHQAESDGGSAPLPPARVACGNRVAVPGAFSLDGRSPARVCVRLAGGDDEPSACVTLLPAAP